MARAIAFGFDDLGALPVWAAESEAKRTQATATAICSLKVCHLGEKIAGAAADRLQAA
jgi:hypothetical protein